MNSSDIQSPNYAALRDMGAPLLEVATQIGREKELLRGEEFDSLLLNANVDASALRSLTVLQMDKLKQVYGDALRLQILQNGYPMWSIDTQDSIAQFNEIQRDLSNLPTATINISLDKIKLLQNVLQQTSNKVLLSLYSERLCTQFSRPFPRIEEFWSGDMFSKINILVCDSDVWLEGAYLSFYGGSHLSEIQEDLLQVSPQDSDLESKCKSMNELCQSRLRWQHSSDQWAKQLTPLHLSTHNTKAQESSNSPRISRVISIQQSVLTMLYTADVTSQIESQCVSVYQRGSTPIKVSWPNILETSKEPRRNISYETAAQHLVSLASWIYEPRWATDRLLMTQSHIAEELRGRQSEFSFDALLDASEDLEADLCSRWKDFIEKRLEGYSDQQRKLEDDVAKTTQVFEEQIGVMTKSLGESGLAATGTVTFAVFAAVFKDVNNLFVPAICLAVYAGYVLFFPLRFGLQLQKERFDATLEEFESRKKLFEKRLDADKVKSIIEGSQIEKVQERFRKWADKSKSVYTALIAASLIIAISLVFFGLAQR